MDRGRDDARLYLQMYPKLRKWLNRCVICQREGCRPDLPADLPPGAAAQNLRGYFGTLELNDKGICAMCEDALNQQQGKSTPNRKVP
jgi:hypothetical protein